MVFGVGFVTGAVQSGMIEIYWKPAKVVHIEGCSRGRFRIPLVELYVMVSAT